MRVSLAKLRVTRRGILHAAEMLARTSLPETLFVATFLLSRYLQNIDFSYPTEIVVPIVLFAVLSAVLFYGYRLILRGVTAAHIASLPVLYGLYEFQTVFDERAHLVRAVLPHKLETLFTVSTVLMLGMIIIAALGGWLVARLIAIRQLRGFQIPKVIMFGVLFLFVTQAGKVGFKLMQIYPELTYQYKPTLPVKQAAHNISSKPDIYYIVLDRYASASTLKQDYGYDNSSFTDYLASKGFVTRDSAYANYPFTMSSISSTLAMNYHTEFGKKFGADGFQTAFPYRNILNNPPVAQALKQDGYTYNQVSSWWDFTRLGVHSDTNPTLSYRLRIGGMQFYLSDLTRDICNKSIFSPLLKKGMTFGHVTIVKYDLDRNPQQNFEAQVSALKQLSSTQHSAPQFTFAHILSPHDPYIFDEDGAPVDYDPGRNDSGADENVKYTKQLAYLNARVEDLVTYMRQHSPDAVIVIQADEGPYPKQFRFPLTTTHYYNPVDLPVPQMRQKMGVLASYYMPNVDSQAVQTGIPASVDAFRFVLARYLGYDLPTLPDCQFAAGNKYNLYHYQLITDKLTGMPVDPRCYTY